jgi:type I restriction enzyme, S subunit
MERDLIDRGWIPFTFDNIASSLKRGPFGSSLKKSFFVPTGYKVYEQQNAINDNHTLGTYYIDEEKYKELKSFTVGPGDYILSCSGTIGRLSRLPKEAPLGVINQALLKITLNENLIHHKYFVYLFHSQLFLNRILKDARGSGMKNLAGIAELRAVPVNLPPKAEQQKIVEKIDEYLSELDNGISNLKLAQEQLKVYRQAVLKKAFEGELTKKWREQQTDLPDTRNLMEQILREWEEATKASGKKIKAVKNLTEAELEELSLLPEGWRWVKLGQVVWSVKDGPHYSPKYEENGIPFISGGNVRASGIDFFNVKYISEELHEELSKRCKPELNDILYTKGGTTGIARVNTYDFDFNVWVHVAVLKTIKSIYPFYLQHALNSFHCYRQSQKYTHGVGNQDLGLTRMILITLPICSFSEQQAVVREIETRLSVCDKIEQDIKENLEKAEALRQSILKKAFEGKLLNERELAEVREAEDWGPAEVLLERIRAERAENGKK